MSEKQQLHSKIDGINAVLEIARSLERIIKNYPGESIIISIGDRTMQIERKEAEKLRKFLEKSYATHIMEKAENIEIIS